MSSQRIFINEELLEKLRKWAHEGLYQYEMAERLGITPEYLSELKKNYPEIKALNLMGKSEKGRENRATRIMWQMIEKADKNAASLIMFYLDRKCGWTSTKKIEIKGDINKLPDLSNATDAEATNAYKEMIEDKK